MTFDNASLFPVTVAVNESDHLTIGGCDVTDLAAEFGTPLYVYDDGMFRKRLDMLRSLVRAG